MFHNQCHTEKATPARHRPERQHNARSNRRKQCSPNKTKPYSQPDTPAQKVFHNKCDAHAYPPDISFYTNVVVHTQPCTWQPSVRADAVSVEERTCGS